MPKDLRFEDLPREFREWGQSPAKDIQRLLTGSPGARGAWKRLSAICGEEKLYGFLAFFVGRIVWKGPFRMPPETMKAYLGESERKLGGLSASMEKLADRLEDLGQTDFWCERWGTPDPLLDLMRGRAKQLKGAVGLLRDQFGETPQDLLVTRHEADFLSSLKPRTRKVPWTDVAVLEQAACEAWLGTEWFGRYAPSFAVPSLKRRVKHFLSKKPAVS